MVWVAVVIAGFVVGVSVLDRVTGGELAAKLPLILAGERSARDGPLFGFAGGNSRDGTPARPMTGRCLARGR